jgi:hypothetical protein
MKIIYDVAPNQDSTAQSDMKKKANLANGRAKHVLRMKHGSEFLCAEHDYVLFRGDTSTGRERRMLGREAKSLNSDYEKKFMDSKTPRLWRWRLVRPA